MTVPPLRQALAAHLGQVLTPEVAAGIEAAAAVPAVVAPMAERVQRLEQSMLGMPQAECPVRHHFAPGLYAREISIPKGTVVTGAIHKTEHLIVLSKGRLQVVTDDGAAVIEAPHTLRCLPGTKNAVHALEDSAWINFFPNPTNETDPDKLVEVLTFSTAAELLGGPDNVQLQAHAARQQLEN